MSPRARAMPLERCAPSASQPVQAHGACMEERGREMHWQPADDTRGHIGAASRKRGHRGETHLAPAPVLLEYAYDSEDGVSPAAQTSC